MNENARDKAVIWVHDEMLSLSWLGYVRRAAERTEIVGAVFVFDDTWVADERLSLKRLVFMAECLEQMPGVEVRRGDVVQEVSAFAEAHGTTRIVSLASTSPRLRRQGEQLGVDWVCEPPFVELPARIDLKRFSRYWGKAKSRVFRTTEEIMEQA